MNNLEIRKNICEKTFEAYKKAYLVRGYLTKSEQDVLREAINEYTIICKQMGF